MKAWLEKLRDFFAPTIEMGVELGLGEKKMVIMGRG